MALQALEGFSRGGRFGWGEPLVVTDLAAELGLSPTPVREALAQMAGYGWIERRPGRGYFAPSLTAADVVDIYELHWAYTRWAVCCAQRARSDSAVVIENGAPAADPLAGGFEGLFRTIVKAGGNDALDRAHARISTRLAPIHRLDRTMVGELLAEEASRVRAMLAEGCWSDLRDWIDHYHRTICARAPEIGRALQLGHPSIFQI